MSDTADARLLVISDLRFSYPARVAADVFSLDVPELTVAPGESVAIIGPSGCGKTTLLSLVAGILVPDAGSVSVNSRTISDLSDEQRRAFRSRDVGFVFQRFELISYLNVLDNIVHVYRVADGLAIDAEVLERAKELAQRLGVADKLQSFPHELSQGESQRVAICRALLSEPKLLLADEPTANLDPANKQIIMDLLFAEAARLQLGVIAVTHDHDLLARFDRVIDFARLRQD